MIRRSARPNRYTVTDNRVLEDGRLSFRALGLLVYLLSKPDDWTVNRDHLAGTHAEGVSAVRSALTELRQAGYLVTEPARADDGQVLGRVAVVLDAPNGGFPAGRSPTGRESAALVSTDPPKTDVPNRSARAAAPDGAAASLPGIADPQAEDNPVDDAAARDSLAWQLVRECYDARARKPIESRKAAARTVARLLAAGWPEGDVRLALMGSPAWTPTSLQVQLTRGRPSGPPGRARSTPADRAGPSRPVTQDELRRQRARG